MVLKPLYKQKKAQIFIKNPLSIISTQKDTGVYIIQAIYVETESQEIHENIVMSI